MGEMDKRFGGGEFDLESGRTLMAASDCSGDIGRGWSAVSNSWKERRSTLSGSDACLHSGPHVPCLNQTPLFRLVPPRTSSDVERRLAALPEKTSSFQPTFHMSRGLALG